MNDMRKLIEATEQLNESVYFDPKVQRELDAAAKELLAIIFRNELDEDDVVSYIEKKLYAMPRDSGFNMRGV